VLPDRGVRCPGLSRMRRKFHVRFLGGGEAAMPLRYPTALSGKGRPNSMLMLFNSVRIFDGNREPFSGPHAQRVIRLDSLTISLNFRFLLVG